MMTRILAACTGGGAGDLLAAMPAVVAIRRHFDSPVDMLTTPYAAPIIEGQPSIGEILVDQSDEPVNSLAERLRQRQYSHAVVFWSNARIARAVQVAGIPTRVGQARRLYSFRYTNRVTVRTEAGDTTSHWTDVQMDYARALGARPTPDDYRIEVRVTPQDLEQAEALRRRTVQNSQFVIFHATRGITAHAPQWPSEHFSLIGDAISRDLGAPVLLTGGRAEMDLVARTAEHMREPAHDVSGQTTLRQFAALATKALVIVALDSGPMHLAASVGAPTVGIFALRTDLPNRWRPLGPRVAVVGPDYPCPRWCRKETCRTFACYAALSPAKVVAAARSLIPALPEAPWKSSEAISQNVSEDAGAVECIRPTST